MLKKLAFTIVILSFILSFGLGVWIYKCENFLKNNYVTLDIRIEKGEPYDKSYEKIFGYLNTPPFLKEYLKYVYSFAKERKFGNYRAENSSLLELVENIKKGIQHNIKVTIPEGYNIFDTAQKLDSLNIIDYKTFLDHITNSAFIAKMTGKKLPSLEGFLYPDTYFLPENSEIENIVSLMYNNFLKNKPAHFDEKVKHFGLSPYEGIILSSIVQKETFVDEEYPVIASVFYNRLSKGMRLQSDPTTIYGIYSSFTGNLQKKHLQNPENVYNTYKHNDLPPTPICSPSKKAMEGVMNPAETDYLYFVATSDGKHSFSKTYEEHRQKVNRYQK
jgi:UPF0755 protein